MQRTPCIGVTGGVACGKSTFAGFLREFGCDILDTDDVAHDLEAPGGEAVPAIVGAFGRGVLDKAGGIDRKALSRIVFADPAALARLDSIVHPLVRRKVAEWRAAPPQEGCALKAVLVPLLFEAGWGGEGADWDAVACVACSPEEQLRRLADRGIGPDEARRRVAAQWPVEKKAGMSDIVVWNDGDVASLREKARETVAALLEKLNERTP